MKRGRKYIVLIIVLLFLGICSNAQDIRADLKQMYENYADMKRFSMDIEVKIYKLREDKTPSQTLRGFIRRDNAKYLAFIGNHLVMVNNDYTVFIDERNKMIIYRDNKEKRGDIRSVSYDLNEVSKSVDSVISKSDTIKYNGVINGGKEYFIEGKKKHLIQLTDVVIDTVTGIIDKVVYYYDPKKMKTNNKIEVEFKNLVSVLPDGDRNFMLSDYLTDRNGQKVAAGRYKGYRVYKDTKKGLN